MRRNVADSTDERSPRCCQEGTYQKLVLHFSSPLREMMSIHDEEVLTVCFVDFFF